MSSGAHSGRHVAVVGGGLAGIAAALAATDAGADVTLIERRRRLGGRTWSFRRNGIVMDNGQHVFMRCCDAYLGFLDRIGARDLVALQPRLDVPVLSPSRPGRPARISRSALPAPLHLAGALLRYPVLRPGERLSAGRALRALSRVDPSSDAADDRRFGDWLVEHGQSRAAVEGLWDLITRPTLNIAADEASLALAAKVFRTGLLDSATGGDLGWATAPLSLVHDERAAAALEAAGVEIVTETAVSEISGAAGDMTVRASTGRTWDVDGAVLAVPHTAAYALLPGVVSAGSPALAVSPIVNVHLVFDRRVTDLPFAATVGSPAQFVFDRSAAGGAPRPQQYLVVSLSAADTELATGAAELIAAMTDALGDLFPAARSARLVDAMVTREPAATFRATPGSGRARPAARTAIAGLALAGAWTATGWPDTMEGAVRSGLTAAAVALDEHAAALPAQVAAS